MLLFPCRHGVRNSLLLAPMPTASTAQILGNNESIEAYTSNIYTRRVLSGEFQVREIIVLCILEDHTTLTVCVVCIDVIFVYYLMI